MRVALIVQVGFCSFHLSCSTFISASAYV